MVVSWGLSRVSMFASANLLQVWVHGTQQQHVVLLLLLLLLSSQAMGLKDKYTS